MSESESVGFAFESGLLIRRSVIGEIKTEAFLNGIKADIEEDRGLLSSHVRVTLTGPGSMDLYNTISEKLRRLTS